jgi:DNA-binding SARP family transcriptional activator
METPWRIELLGGLCARRGQHVIAHFRTRKTGALLAYLAYHPGRMHPREVLMEVLWPEDGLESARHKFSVALSSLRGQLEPPGIAAGSVLMADHFAAGLNGALVRTDVAEFETALKAAAAPGREAERGDLLAHAVELYRGELLPGCYEEWVLPEQQRLNDLLFQALHQLVAHLEQTGDLERALPYAFRAISAAPTREEGHCSLMRLYAALGQPSEALRQYRELERILKQEFASLPSPATRALSAGIERAGVREQESGGVGEPESGTRKASSTLPPSHSRGQQATQPAPLEPVGGAVSLGSPFYVVRPTDEEFQAAIARGDSVVLVKGASQVGKTSLLARGLQQARQGVPSGPARVALTNFQLFNAAQLESAETLLLALAQALADQLDLEVAPADVWDGRRGANPNLWRYLRREVLGAAPAPLVWGLDEVDRLFTCPYGNEIFALFRSWHNERATDPQGPWGRLTLAIAYATEAHLFITDLNQSPFNVGTRLTLDDFTLEQVAELNLRHGSPLKSETAVARFFRLVGGHPYLVRRGLHELATHGIDIDAFEARAGSRDWIFGDHLQRMRAALTRDPDLCEAVRGVLRGRPCPSPDSFYRLQSAGVLAGPSPGEARPRCQLYAAYLEGRLG